jgi:AbrB family looped-hinge helix DNA binding protein
MPIRFERKVFTAGGSLRVNIPAEITKALGISEGDTLLISTNDHQIVMEKKKGKA